jgi:hypothetical protein
MYTFSSFQCALALEMAVPTNSPTIPPTDPNFVAIVPTLIDYAEQRCYRDLDCQHALTEQLFPMTALTRNQSYLAANAVFANPSPAQQILIPERVVVEPPTGYYPFPVPPAKPTAGGEPATPTTVDYLDAVYSGIYPNAGPTGRPVKFAPLDDVTLVFGPTPDLAYYFWIHGKCRPVPLYNLGPTGTTFLTTVLPDLFLACAMVSASGYRKNYGAQADEPRMAQSWESQYEILLGSAKNEELRKRFLGWQSSSRSSPPSPPAPMQQ